MQHLQKKKLVDTILYDTVRYDKEQAKMNEANMDAICFADQNQRIIGWMCRNAKSVKKISDTIYLFLLSQIFWEERNLRARVWVWHVCMHVLHER